jgi:hypothetical protein
LSKIFVITMSCLVLSCLVLSRATWQAIGTAACFLSADSWLGEGGPLENSRLPENMQQMAAVAIVHRWWALAVLVVAYLLVRLKLRA